MAKIEGQTDPTKALEPSDNVQQKSKRQMRLEEKRKRRVPPGIPSKKLDYPSRPGYVRRVVVDHPGRLDQFEKGGWEFVSQDRLAATDEPDENVTTREGVDSRVSRVVGQHRDGSPMTGYLMEIEEELYQEDQKQKAKRIDELESGLRAGRLEGGSSTDDGGYVKQVKIGQGGRNK